MDKQSNRFELKMSDDTLQKLNDIAKALGLSRSAVIKFLINSYSVSGKKFARNGGDTTTPPHGNQ